MAETVLHETGRHRTAVPLGPQSRLLRSAVVAQDPWPAATEVAATAASRALRSATPPATPPAAPPAASAVGVPEAQLGRLWLAALAVSGPGMPPGQDEIPMDLPTARRFFIEQSAALISVLLGSPFQPRRAAVVGHALVKADFVGADVLGRSLRVLILRLPALIRTYARADATADLERRVAEVTEALANGYVRALRDRTLAEQESIRRAELDAQRIISERLRHEATHDPLTGLPNRAAVFGRLSAVLASGRDTRLGLCYLDLDGFKGVNDRYGHDAGDELLVRVAGRIGRVARGHRTIAARIGGDEFVVLAESSPGVRGMIALATAILVEISRPVSLRIGRVRVSACAGIAECAAGSPAAATLVADADVALYRAKFRGPGHWTVADPVCRQVRWPVPESGSRARIRRG